MGVATVRCIGECTHATKSETPYLTVLSHPHPQPSHPIYPTRCIGGCSCPTQKIDAHRTDAHRCARNLPLPVTRHPSPVTLTLTLNPQPSPSPLTLTLTLTRHLRTGTSPSTCSTPSRSAAPPPSAACSCRSSTRPAAAATSSRCARSPLPARRSEGGDTPGRMEEKNGGDRAEIRARAVNVNSRDPCRQARLPPPRRRR